MQDNVRTVKIVNKDADPIEANHWLMNDLRIFLEDNAEAMFVGAIQITADSVLVQFEALEGHDPDEIVREYASGSGDAERTREDRSQSTDGTTPDPSPTGTPAASTRDRDASHADTDAATIAHPAGTAASDADDDSPPWESTGDDDDSDDEGRARPWALVREDGTTIATYATSESAWGAFENHDDAFDVENREEN